MDAVPAWFEERVGSSGTRPKLLRAVGNALCLGCHRTPDHLVLAPAPSPSPKVRPTKSVFKGELSCLACHDPHKGKSGRLLRWGAVSSADACLNCHPK